MAFSFSFISYNVFGAPFHGQKIIRTLLRTKVRKRFRIIAQEIMKKDIDIVFLQEVHTYPHLFILRQALKTEYKLTFQPGIFGPKGGLVIFSKLSKEKKAYIDFYDKGAIWNTSITGPLTQRGMLLMKLKNHNLWLINTHLTQNPSYEFSETGNFANLLKSQLNQCAATVRALKKLDNEVIIAGDFNLPDYSLLYPEFMNNGEVEDVFSKNPKATYIEWFGRQRKSGRDDYVFYAKKGRLKATHNDHLFSLPHETQEGETHLLSDHIALLATFQM